MDPRIQEAYREPGFTAPLSIYQFTSLRICCYDIWGRMRGAKCIMMRQQCGHSLCFTNCLLYCIFFCTSTILHFFFVCFLFTFFHRHRRSKSCSSGEDWSGEKCFRKHHPAEKRFQRVTFLSISHQCVSERIS